MDSWLILCCIIVFFFWLSLFFWYFLLFVIIVAVITNIFWWPNWHCFQIAHFVHFALFTFPFYSAPGLQLLIWYHQFITSIHPHIHYNASLFFFFQDYTSSLDLWSCGCIFGELLQSSPLFPAATEMEEIELIVSLLGRMDTTTFPRM